MAFSDEVKKSINRVYCDVYLKRRYPSGSFDAEWIDITRWVVGGGIDRVKYALDSGDFDVGIFVANSVRLSFDNSRGRFSEKHDPRSYWAALDTRHLSKVKIEAGYITDDDERSAATPFNGIWDDTSFTTDDSDQASVTLLAREAAMRRCSVVAGTLSSSVLASAAIYTLCSRAEVTDYITVSLANINPANDITIDDPTVYVNQKLDAVLNEICLITNSVLYVNDAGALIVTGRSHTAAVKYAFNSNSETGERDNVYAVRNVNSGRQRVKNAWIWSNTSLSASSSLLYLTAFGTTRKSISTAAVTTNGTRQAIINALRDEFQFPKMELEIETDYMPGEVTFYDTVTLDVRPRLGRQDDLPLAGAAVSGSALSVDYVSGLHIPSDMGWKVLAIEHDLLAAKTILKLRNIGTGLTDGLVVDTDLTDNVLLESGDALLLESGDEVLLEG